MKTVSDVLIKTTRPSAAFNFKFGSFHGRFISGLGTAKLPVLITRYILFIQKLPINF